MNAPPRSAVADELAIRNLVARIALTADFGELDDYAELFTDDAVWDMPGGRRQGRGDIRAGAEERRAAGITGPGSASRHSLTTLAVDVTGADTATGDCYFVFYRDTTTQPAVFNMGHYHDEFRYEDGRWLLARRQITLG